MAKKKSTGKPKSDFIGGLQHRGGKKLSQPGTEFVHKIKEVRQHPPRGYRGKHG